MKKPDVAANERKELSDEQFEKRSAVLIKAYADLVKKGLPEEGLAKWNAKMDKLPPIARETIRRIVEMDPTLLRAIAGVPDIDPPGSDAGVPVGAPSRW